MKIVDRAVKKVYRFNCPNCQSRLEGESKEFEDIGGKIIANSSVRYARRIVILPGPTLGRRRCMKARIRNNYNSLYEKNIF